MSLPTTKTGLPIVAKVRSTRKGQQMATSNGTLGVKGRDGRHYYDITVVGGISVAERLQCNCPAHRYGRANLVKETGLCKHLTAIADQVAYMDLEEFRTGKNDIIVYSTSAIKGLLETTRRVCRSEK